MLRRTLLVTCVLALGASHSAAAPPAAGRAVTLCASLAAAVDAVPGSGAAFVTSYRPAAGEPVLPPALATTAFTYDNALAAIALTACGHVGRARRIGDALLAAIARDRSFTDGRVRNAYRAGAVGAGPVLLPGWWDTEAGHWAEDPYQDGSATGNVAWAALALLTLHQAGGHAADRDGARRLLDWIIDHAAGDDGFRGGTFGYDPQQSHIAWMSTEHNIDVAAVAQWLFRLTGDPRHKAAFDSARAFVARAFDAGRGSFRIGTRPDGTLSTEHDVLDVQLWPWMAIDGAPAEWRRALGFAERDLSVDGGFDFNADRDGLWVEGTAQAALAYRIAGQGGRAAALIAGLDADVADGGFLHATRGAKLTTGLSIEPEGKTPDFFYFRRPHLGATAWAALAAAGWNPFTGRRVE